MARPSPAVREAGIHAWYITELEKSGEHAASKQLAKKSYMFNTVILLAEMYKLKRHNQ